MQSTTQSIDQSIDLLLNQPISHSINQSINQPTNQLLTTWRDVAELPRHSGVHCEAPGLGSFTTGVSTGVARVLEDRVDARHAVVSVRDLFAPWLALQSIDRHVHRATVVAARATVA